MSRRSKRIVPSRPERSTVPWREAERGWQSRGIPSSGGWAAEVGFHPVELLVPGAPDAARATHRAPAAAQSGRGSNGAGRSLRTSTSPAVRRTSKCRDPYGWCIPIRATSSAAKVDGGRPQTSATGNTMYVSRTNDSTTLDHAPTASPSRPCRCAHTATAQRSLPRSRQAHGQAGHRHRPLDATWRR